MTSNVDLDMALARRNPTANALGNVKRIRIFGLTFYMSPDVCVWLVPSGITLGLAIGTFYMTGDTSPLWEKACVLGLMLTAFTASITVGMTDPGIYPRLQPGEVDPLEGAGHGFTLCRPCNVRRPPRAAHCYVCNVCVLEHDHHCGVIGGCVGARSLRWFTLYLVSVSTASLWALFWLLLDVTGVRPHIPPAYVSTSSVVPNDLRSGGAVDEAVVTRPPSGRKRSNRNRDHSSESMATAMDIMLMVFIVNVVLVVGGLALYYVYLLCKDTTRREAQGKYVRPSMPALGVIGTLRKSLFPPPSMLEMPQHDGGLLTASRNQGGIV